MQKKTKEKIEDCKGKITLENPKKKTITEV